MEKIAVYRDTRNCIGSICCSVIYFFFVIFLFLFKFLSS